MRISINLASRPFAELGPLFARLRLAMAGLALLAIGLGVGLHFLSLRAAAAETQMDALKAQVLAVQTERQANERRMQQPQNRAVLDRSKFLNDLFARKSFSWTAVMMDLESVLPAGVEVTSIDPAITAEGDVNIRLRVSGNREPAVDLVRRLERSKRFLEPRLANETAQTQEGKTIAVSAAANAPGMVEFDIVSGYNPLPAPPKVSPGKIPPKADAVKHGAPAAPLGHKPANKFTDKTLPAPVGGQTGKLGAKRPGGTR
jgi:type IV pilus assembly protein PilN